MISLAKAQGERLSQQQTAELAAQSLFTPSPGFFEGFPWHPQALRFTHLSASFNPSRETGTGCYPLLPRTLAEPGKPNSAKPRKEKRGGIGQAQAERGTEA